MKRADKETTVGDWRLREASVSLCRNKATLFHVSLKALRQRAESDQAHQPDRQKDNWRNELKDQHWQQKGPYSQERVGT